MLGLLASILPFAAGASVTPTILLLQLRYCGGAGGSRATGMVFAAGCATVLLVVTGLALALAAGTGGAESSPVAVGIVKLALALVLAAYGAWSLRRPADRAGGSGVSRPESPLRTFAVGMAMMATNFTSLALYFPAIHEIGVSRAGLVARVAAVGLLLLATMLPALVPLLPGGPVGRMLGAPLERVHEIVAAHERAFLAVLTFPFAAYLGLQGLVRLA